jgi:outer membrane protein assembly factor BamD (BamD/ComL family)
VKNSFARFLPFVVATALGTGCTTIKSLKHKAQESTRGLVSKSYDDPRAAERLAEAERQYEAGEYAKCRPTFHELANNTLNPALLSEKARYLEAECFRQTGKYPDAVDTYHKMLLEHPTGAYRERASNEMFKIADYWLDDTRAEIQAEQDGQNMFLHKTGKFFKFDKTKPTMDREGRALQTLEHVHLNDITGPTADKALFWCGFVNFYRGNFVEADHYFSTLIEFHRDSPLRPKATELAIISKNNSTGGAVYDGQKASEALQLVNHAEASMPEFTDTERRDFLTRQKLAIRSQQAEKDFKTAEYHEQTKHPGSAYFCYEIVRRRYPGTKYSDLATQRMEAIRAQAEADAGKPKTVGPVQSAIQGIESVLGGTTVPTASPGVLPPSVTAAPPGTPRP